MSICLDFNNKNVCVEQTPLLISGYLKFNDFDTEKVKISKLVALISICRLL